MPVFANTPDPRQCSCRSSPAQEQWASYCTTQNSRCRPCHYGEIGHSDVLHGASQTGVCLASPVWCLRSDLCKFLKLSVGAMYCMKAAPWFGKYGAAFISHPCVGCCSSATVRGSRRHEQSGSWGFSPVWSCVQSGSRAGKVDAENPQLGSWNLSLPLDAAIGIASDRENLARSGIL